MFVNDCKIAALCGICRLLYSQIHIPLDHVSRTEMSFETTRRFRFNGEPDSSMRRSERASAGATAPQHRWSYFSAMDRHEALVFKQFDAQVSGVARFTLHAAFDHPQAPTDAPCRESIELRCLVVYE